MSTGLLEGTASGSAGKACMTVINPALAGTANATKATHTMMGISFFVVIFLLSVLDDMGRLFLYL